ncbi:hypothetical protein FOZ60_013908 [Perkinsus olseni]|uniref:Cytochrome P450 n=1 Tax=Perkinsus olseni TaxID=32597 RepID=A0A7J6N8R1_PEROL|nr:hypothetical protein FOZ60_013908 [Perkinsus olseni]
MPWDIYLGRMAGSLHDYDLSVEVRRELVDSLESTQRKSDCILVRLVTSADVRMYCESSPDDSEIEGWVHALDSEDGRRFVLVYLEVNGTISMAREAPEGLHPLLRSSKGWGVFYGSQRASDRGAACDCAEQAVPPLSRALTSTRLMFEILQLTFILVVNHLEAASLEAPCPEGSEVLEAVPRWTFMQSSVDQITITGTNMIILSKPELVRQVLDERPRTFIRPFNKHKIIPVSGMFTTEAAMVPDMLKVSLKLIRQLKSLSQNGRIVWRPIEWLPLCTLDVLCVNILGNDYNFLDPDGRRLGSRSEGVPEAIVDTLSGSGACSTAQFLSLDDTGQIPLEPQPNDQKGQVLVVGGFVISRRQMHTGVKRLNTVCDEIISSRRAERQAAGGRVQRRDLLDKLLHLDPEDLRETSSRELFLPTHQFLSVSGRSLVAYNATDRKAEVLASGDTTAMTLSWCVYNLSLNPQIQAKARVEVDALGHDPKTIADLNKLPYVECCILETLRLQSPSRFLLNECVDDTVLDGKPVPAGTVVAVLQHQVMVKSRGGTTYKYLALWPVAFNMTFLNHLRPERWLTNDGVSIDRALVRDHLAFGGGPRQCPGQNMALKEATIILALILRFFDDIELNHSPSCVRGKITFTYGPENLELQMCQRAD